MKEDGNFGSALKIDYRRMSDRELKDFGWYEYQQNLLKPYPKELVEEEREKSSGK